jgi:hypothetical protein
MRVDRRLAQGASRTPDDGLTDSWAARFPGVLIGLGLVALAALVYWSSAPDRYYNHFVWQALAFLDGRAAIDYPVGPIGGTPGNSFFQDVLPVPGPNGETTGYGLLPFPPLPAIVLMPFVAIWGIATEPRVLSVVLGAIDVGLAWWVLGRLPVSQGVRFATAAFFGFGTVFWYAAQLGTTWFLAHVVALAPALVAVGIALGADPEAADEDHEPPESPIDDVLDAIHDRVPLLDRRQVLAGLLFGIACTARLTIAFGAPFFLFVGAGGSWFRRGLSAAVGAAIPIGLLLVFNLVATGSVVNPAYEYLYRLETYGWPGLHYNPEWAIEDPRYLPQNADIMFLKAPLFLPDATPNAIGPGRPLCVDTQVRALFDPECPIALPNDVGMSVLLTSPAYLLAIPALRSVRRSRLVAGGVIAVAAISLVNLMHFSQGWVQFGYRFSNDFVMFALPLVALGISRRGGVGLLGAGLILASVAVNFWGVTWGNLLGW